MICVDDQEFLANLGYVLLCFLVTSWKFMIFVLLSVLLYSVFSLLHTRSLLAPYEYDSIKSID